MKKLFQQLFIALCVAALPLYAIADYTATQGAGTTVFAFLCQSTKVCPAHTIINSSGTEIMTGPSPGFVQLTNSNATVSGNVGITGTVTVSPSNIFPVIVAGGVNVNNTVSVSQANVPFVKGSGTFTISGANTMNVLENNSSAILTAVQAAIPAGTNLIGKVGIDQTTPGTTNNVTVAAINAGGFTTLTMTNLLSTANVIKASAGQVAKLYCYNPNASVAYVQVFNVAAGSVTPGTTKPAQTYGIPATNAAGFSMSPVGDQYSTAISALASTTATGGTAPGTGLDCSVSFN